MGCWNATCGLSQLPINYDDEVKMVLLVTGNNYNEFSTGSGFCYPDDMFKPLFFPINGTYNDYGGIDVTENKQELIDAICKRLSPNKQVTNFNRLLEKVWHDKLPGISFTLIHKEVYDKFIYLTAAEKFRGTQGSLREHFEEVMKITVEHAEYFNDYMQKLVAGEASHMDTSFIHRKNNIEHYTRCLPMIYKSSADYKFIASLQDEAVEFMVMDKAMNNARKFWSPQSGAGGQGVDYKYAIAIGNIAKNIIKRERASVRYI